MPEFPHLKAGVLRFFLTDLIVLQGCYVNELELLVAEEAEFNYICLYHNLTTQCNNSRRS
jgi:hypothetical protein